AGGDEDLLLSLLVGGGLGGVLRLDLLVLLLVGVGLLGLLLGLGLGGQGGSLRTGSGALLGGLSLGALGGLKLLDEVGQSLQLGEVLVGELVVIDRVDRLGGGAGTSESRSKILTLQGGEVLGDLEVHSSHSSWV